ncbi:MAG: DUF3105 domain-containing protein [Chloroflexi bacterium]|nr:DUF3105 domain-containing protein [Chloroflexota bacterium]
MRKRPIWRLVHNRSRSAAIAACAAAGLVAAACGSGDGTDHPADPCTPPALAPAPDALPIVDSKSRETNNGETSFTITVLTADGETVTFFTTAECWERATLGEVSPDAATAVAPPGDPTAAPIPVSSEPSGPIDEHPGFADLNDQVDELGSEHLVAGTSFSYPITPPAGGPHWEIPARCGIYADPIPYEALVHTTEHGAIIMYYDPAAWTPATVAQFEALAREILNGGDRFVLAPAPASPPFPRPIVLATWGYLLFLDEFEPNTIREFVDEFENEGPEVLPRLNAC